MGASSLEDQVCAGCGWGLSKGDALFFLLTVSSLKCVVVGVVTTFYDVALLYLGTRWSISIISIHKILESYWRIQ